MDLLRDAIVFLLEGVPSDISIPELKKAIEQIPGIVSIHDLQCVGINIGLNALSVHVVIDKESIPDEIKN